MENRRCLVKQKKRFCRLLISIAAVVLLCLVVPLLIASVRLGILWVVYVRFIGYETAVLELVHKHEKEVASKIALATSLPPPEAVEHLRFLLREHSRGEPPADNDEGWLVRIRALRTLSKYDSSLRATAIPEFTDLLTREHGYIPFEVRDILIALGCEAIPASPKLVEIVRHSDEARSELAISILVRLAVDCPEQFTYNEEIALAILERVRDPRTPRYRRLELIRDLSTFDRTGEVCGNTLLEILDDPQATEELKEMVRSTRLQMGLK